MDDLCRPMAVSIVGEDDPMEEVDTKVNIERSNDWKLTLGSDDYATCRL